MRFIDVSRVRSRFEDGLNARDGVRLSFDIYLPPEHGRYPVLVTRTPYDNNRSNRAPGTTTLLPSPSDRFKKLAAHGFVVMACDVRGRGDSDGAFVPFAHEAEDGQDTVEVARDLPECDGHIGTFGSGYAGFTALAAAATTSIDAVAVWSPFSSVRTPFRGGALRLDWLFWMHLAGGRTVQPVDVPHWDEIFRYRPLISMDEALGREDIPWRDWLDGGVDLRPVDQFPPTAPTLSVSGWWDPALAETVRMWESAGPDHALVVGPWDTGGVRHPRPDVGGVDWGPAALVDPDELLLDWFSAHLKGEGDPLAGAQLFVTGRNEWVTHETFADGSAPSELWLASGGRANTRRGDGKLLFSPHHESPPDRFTHNPDDPVPWQPGYGSFSRFAPARLTLDTGFATARDDVLVYESEPVLASLCICGRPAANLWVHSTADDADWVVAIEDVFPGGGRSVHLAHAILRAGTRGGASPLEVTFDMTPVAHELLPGHSLRLLVASSLFPLYAVNLGGADYLHDTAPRLSEHTVFHDADFPSRIQIPIRTHL